MAENKFNRGDIVTVTNKNGEIEYMGMVNGWDYNPCTFEIEYEIDYYNHKHDKAFTLMGVPEERINLKLLTDKQRKLFNEFIDGSKRKGKLAIENSDKWVLAGYAGGKADPEKLYCYCGKGYGYQGADVTPACGIAIIFDTQEAAEKKDLTTWNGHGEKIELEPMEAYRFFNILQAQAFKAALIILHLILNTTNNK